MSLKLVKPDIFKGLLKGKCLIAGPCSAESPEQILQTAKDLSQLPVSIYRAGIWKPRTRPGSFEGFGEKALSWLRAAGDETGLPVATEVAEPSHVELCLKHNIDIIWIGARTTVNPFSVQAIADVLKGVDKIVMVKNPVSPDLELWIGALERLNHAGITKLAAIHRGFTPIQQSAFRNPPFWRIPLELQTRIPSLPLFCDPSHITGNRSLLFGTAQQAFDFLFDGLMIEVHPDPPKALSDAAQQITPTQFEELINSLHLTTAKQAALQKDPTVQALREKIDEIDHKIISLFGKRMETAIKLGAVKDQLNASTFQPDRFKQLLAERIKLGTSKGLSEEFVHKIYELIHEEALKQQEANRLEDLEKKV